MYCTAIFLVTLPPPPSFTPHPSPHTLTPSHPHSLHTLTTHPTLRTVHPAGLWVFMEEPHPTITHSLHTLPPSHPHSLHTLPPLTPSLTPHPPPLTPSLTPHPHSLHTLPPLTPHCGQCTLRVCGSSGSSPIPQSRAGHRTPPICSTNSSVPNRW